MQPIAGDPELLNHFAVVVYPFAHHVVGAQRLVPNDQAGERGQPPAGRRSGRG
jgi:hypothetical protein